MKQQTRVDEIEFMFEAPFPTPEFMSQSLKVLALPDGKRYLADVELGGNTIFVARVHRDGVLDTDFGGSGWLAESLELSGLNRYTGGLLSRDGGGVLAAMSSDTQFGLVCFDVNGDLDPGFGQNGIIVHDFFQGSGEAEVDRTTNPSENSQNAQRTTGGLGAIIPGEDGKFFGFLRSLYNFPSTLILFKSDGQLDPEFNGNGVVTISHPTLHATAAGIVSASEGGVVVVGQLADGPVSAGRSVFFCRYNRDGSLDEQFGTDGFAVFDSKSLGIPPLSLVQVDLPNVTNLANGGFAASGDLTAKDPWQYFGLVICVDSHGVPIESFNTGKPLLFEIRDEGEVETSFRFGGIAEQPDKIVVGGGVNERSSGYQRDMLVVRFHSDGTIDSRFGKQGVVRVRPFDYWITYMSDLLLDSAGKILVAGAGGPDNQGGSHRNFVVQFD